MSEEHPPQYAEHLEFLGYQCERYRDGWLYAAHPVRWNFFLRPIASGVRFHCTIRLGPLSDAKRLAWLEFLNRRNQQSLVSRFTIEPDAEVFVIRARTLAPREYRRAEFGVWIDMWHDDLAALFRDNPSLDEEEEHEEEAKMKNDDVTVH